MLTTVWIAVLVFTVPGLLVSWVSGLKVPWAAAASIPVSFGIYGVAAWVLGMMDMRFDVRSVAISTVIAVVLALIWRLGFVAATEQQVCKHLQQHLQDLPTQDNQSRAVVTQMLRDEARHADMALMAGGLRFPAPVKGLMTLISSVMTKTSYRI